MGRASQRIGLAMASIAVLLLFFRGGNSFQLKIIAVGVMGIFLSYLLARRRFDFRPSPVFYLCLAWLGFTALQLIPIPRTWLEFINPHGAYSQTSSWGTWSQAPSATAANILLPGLACIGLLAAMQVRQKHILKNLGPTLWAVACVCALGILSSISTSLNLPINPNHQASILGIGIILALFYATSTSVLRHRWLYWLSIPVLGLALFLTQSRSAFVLAMLFAGSIFLLRRPHSQSMRAFSLSLGTLILIASLAGIYFLQTSFSTLLHGHSFNKLELWPKALAMIGAQPLLGTGYGAFPYTFTRYAPGGVFKTFTHVESLLFQASLDYGLLIATLFWCIGLLITYRLWRRRKSFHHVYAPTFLFLLAHNLVDFSLSLPLLLLPLLVFAQAALSTAKPAKKVRRIWGLALFTISTSIVTISILGQTYSAQNAQTELRSYDDAQNSYLHYLSIEKYFPSDGYLPLTVANQLLNQSLRPQEVFKMVNRAMWLIPNAPGPHRLAAEQLRRMGLKKQALTEYILASKKYSSPQPELIKQVYGLRQSPEDILALNNGTIYWRYSKAQFLVEHKHHSSAWQAIHPLGPFSNGPIPCLATRIALKLNKCEEAFKLSDDATQSPSQNACAYQSRAATFKQCGSPLDAIQSLELGLKRLGLHWHIARDLFFLLVENKKILRARELLITMQSEAHTSAQHRELKTLGLQLSKVEE